MRNSVLMYVCTQTEVDGDIDVHDKQKDGTHRYMYKRTNYVAIHSQGVPEYSPARPATAAFRRSNKQAYLSHPL